MLVKNKELWAFGVSRVKHSSVLHTNHEAELAGWGGGWSQVLSARDEDGCDISATAGCSEEAMNGCSEDGHAHKRMLRLEAAFVDHGADLWMQSEKIWGRFMWAREVGFNGGRWFTVLTVAGGRRRRLSSEDNCRWSLGGHQLFVFAL